VISSAPPPVRHVPAGGPVELLLVRHGESDGNVARERAMAAGAEVIDVDRCDADVPLSEIGAQQPPHWAAGS